MDKITQAVQRAQNAGGATAPPPSANSAKPQAFPSLKSAVLQDSSAELRNSIPLANGTSKHREIMLDKSRLEANRIISFDIEDPRSKAFDILRTQVLQTMDMKGWQLLGITSPKPGCGKTVTAINLALAIARQPHRSVVLIDMDMQKPQVARYLGLKDINDGVLNVLEGHCDLSSIVLETHIRNQKLWVLPCEASTLRSSALMASRAMTAFLQEVRRQFANSTIILDLPPLLTSDDVITVLPQIDSVLFVTGAGITTKPEIKECNKYLETTPVVRIVLTQATDSVTNYYGRY